MKQTRSKFWALFGAAVLTIGVAGLALATDLKDGHTGIEIGWDNGTPYAEDASGEPFPINTDADCAESDLGVGEIEIHFVLAPTSDEEGLLWVDFDGADDVNGQPADGNQGGQLDWDVFVTANANPVILVSANTDAEGGNLVISHICVGDAPEEPSEEPSFEQSQEAETEEPSEVPSEEPSEVPSEEPSEVPSEEPSFEQSQEAETEEPSEVPSEEPSFEQSVAADTEVPTEPPTNTIGGGTSGPADGAWLLVVALGVFLASVVVLTPARAKVR